MKTVKGFSLAGMIAIIFLLASGCAKDKSSLPKSSQLAVNFLTRKSAALKSSGAKGTTAGNAFTLNSVKISIANLIIEENSGNDVEQQGNFNDGGADTETKSKEGAGTENSDVLMAGPFVLNVTDSIINIDKVNIYPGTFKKVDFTFLVSNDTGFGGNSIVVNGNYLRTDGMVLPVVLRSDFNQQVQLPLANGGITVTANSLMGLSIVLDIPLWINNLDLSSAAVLNNEILIDKTNNPQLLKLFEANLASGIEVEH